MSMLFAAVYPERTKALCTFGSTAKRIRSVDYPWAPTWEERQETFAEVERQWTSGLDWADTAPSLDPARLDELSRYYRRCASPGAAVALMRMNTHVDVRDVLPSIRVPTVVMHRTDDRDAQVGEGRYIASQIPGARFVEFPGADHSWWTQGPGRDPGRGRGARHRRQTRAGAQPCPGDRPLHRSGPLDGAAARARRPRLGASCSGVTMRRSRRRARPVPGPRDRHRRRWVLRHVRRPRPSDPLRPGDTRQRRASWGSSSAPASTPASASSSETRSPGSPSTSAPASPRSPRRARCSPRRPSGTSSPARVSLRGPRRARPQGHRHPPPLRGRLADVGQIPACLGGASVGCAPGRPSPRPRPRPVPGSDPARRRASRRSRSRRAPRRTRARSTSPVPSSQNTLRRQASSMSAASAITDWSTSAGTSLTWRWSMRSDQSRSPWTGSPPPRARWPVSRSEADVGQLQQALDLPGRLARRSPCGGGRSARSPACVRPRPPGRRRPRGAPSRRRRGRRCGRRRRARVAPRGAASRRLRTRAAPSGRRRRRRGRAFPPWRDVRRRALGLAEADRDVAADELEAGVARSRLAQDVPVAEVARAGRARSPRSRRRPWRRARRARPGRSEAARR